MINPSDTTIKQLLSQAKTIAIIGAKDKSGQPVDAVGQYLLSVGYTIIPIHPTRKYAWEIPCYSSILDVPIHIDIINLFRSPEFCLTHAHEAIKLIHKPKLFWMQKGITNEKAVSIVKESGIAAVEDRCIMIEHQRLIQEFS